MKLVVWMCVAALCTACQNSTRVTGQNNPTAAGTQSETAAVTSYTGNTQLIVVAYNDETNEQDLITYTQSNRVINKGASLMGWSYSKDGGATWIYGGKVSPPANWAVLWGDPAIATSGSNYDVVFMANLAMPSSKFPAGGIQGYVYYGNGLSSYVGGACIARSTDGGQHFANYQCIANTQPVAGVPDSGQGHFYDGGSLVSNPLGEIYAAYVDVVTSKADVYRSPDANGTFQQIATPFPGLTVSSHVLLRAGRDSTIYAAAQVLGTDYNYYVYLNRFVNGAWGNPVRASNASQLYPGIDFGTSVQGSELTLRTGPQFGFDVGAASTGGADAVRMLYTQMGQNGHLSLGATACKADLSMCSNVAGWEFQGSGPGGAPIDTFNPDVSAWVGFFGTPPTWQSSWAYHYGNTNFVNVSRATLGYVNGQAGTFPVDVLENAPLCSDQRGYWGDYDAFLLTGFQNGGTVWMRFSTDSSAGCPERWAYVGVSQHIQQSHYTF